MFRKILRLPNSISGKIRSIFFAKGHARTRSLVLLLFLFGIIAATLDYPAYWNQSAGWLTNRIQSQNKVEKIPVPDFYRFGVKIGYFDTNTVTIPHITIPFKLGLDLQGGAHLVYEADVSAIDPSDTVKALDGLRDVIERRVNYYGVTEPVVQVVKSGEHHRLIVELPGKNVDDAIRFVGDAPFLEFREEGADQEGNVNFVATGLTGEYLARADITFDPTTRAPLVAIEFNEEGAKKFEELTKRNVGRRIAIVIDEIPISAPVVQEPISGGKAQITGDFTIEAAKSLARNLTAGALPVPVKLVFRESIGPSLGKISLDASIKAGLWGIILVTIFMVIYYRLAGIVAVLALGFYTASVLLLLKLFSITLTLPGIAGFILSIGMAVDANIITFERLKEELRQGKSFAFSLDESFRRSWLAIRDGHIATLITAAILFWVGTGFIKGFAFTLAVGLILNLFSALVVTRSLLRLFIGSRLERVKFAWRG